MTISTPTCPHARNVAKACNFHTRTLQCATCAAFLRMTSPGQSRVQHRRFEARLLQRAAMRSTGDDVRQTAARPEQLGRSRLPLSGLHRRQADAPVAPLAYLSDLVQTHVPTGSFVHPTATLRCWSFRAFPGHRPKSLSALFLLQLATCSPIHLELCRLQTVRERFHFQAPLETHLFRLT